jgi:hypothetical protein
MHAWTYVCMHVCMYVYVNDSHVCAYVCMHVCLYVRMHACICMHACMHACTYSCVYVCLSACTCVYINILMYYLYLQERTGFSKVNDMVRRCRLVQPFHLWCIAFAATSQWHDVSDALRQLLERTFSGWVQTRINEKANKVLRDSQTRDNASKAFMCMC